MATLLTWIVGRKRSFGYAINGLCTLYRETNARIHAAATVCVFAIGASLGLRPLEWTLLAIAATVVWVAEALNTALEALSDATVPEHSPHIAVAKDVAAGAVLLASLGAVAVGLLVFVPHLTARFGAPSW
ncbi:MAG TPA: diacylglycerol kinase family protein [Polyangiaceae bacterium]|nr:diacylglycerol kinase family protein [Polyangiaceae bacterium]